LSLTAATEFTDTRAAGISLGRVLKAIFKFADFAHLNPFDKNKITLMSKKFKLLVTFHEYCSK